jgi:hypothetical protein
MGTPNAQSGIAFAPNLQWSQFALIFVVNSTTIVAH